MHISALQDLRVADVLLLDNLWELLEESLDLRVCSFEVGGALALMASVVFLLDETRDLVEFVEDPTLVDFLLFHEDALHEVDKFEDITRKRVDSDDLEFFEYFLEAGEKGQLVFVLDVEQIEEVMLLLWYGYGFASL